MKLTAHWVADIFPLNDSDVDRLAVDMTLRSFLTSLFLAPLAGFRRKRKITVLDPGFCKLPYYRVVEGWYDHPVVFHSRVWLMKRNFIPPERL